MRLIQDVVIAKNTGRIFILKKGQHIRVIGESTADFVPFNLDNLRERFDQARTKMDHLKIFLSTGDRLISKFNNVMLTIIEDTFKEGTHDLQKGMCRAESYQELGLNQKDLPDHGCWDNLIKALKPWNIKPEDIPSPFDIFQHMSINGKTGEIQFLRTKPKPGTYVELRAEMNLLVAISACWDAGGGKAIGVQVYE